MTSREAEILEKVKTFAEILPKFPDGRIDYSKAAEAPVLIIFLKYKDELLFLKRSQKVIAYKGKWSVIAGFLDDFKSPKDKVLEEVSEEVSIGEDIISSIHFGEPYKFLDNQTHKTWIRHPVIVELKEQPEINLDWEHEESRWIRKEEFQSFDTVPGIIKSWEQALK